VYAKYRDAPHNNIPRWIIGGDPIAVARARGEILSNAEIANIQLLAEEYPVLKEQLEQLRTTYYMIKND
jgi:phosphoribosylcarboxyaminoimidazole (NCAIR) mutase